MTQARSRTGLSLAAPAALGLAVIALAVVLFAGGGPSYSIRIRFADAGQLITGDRVEVAGIPVGTITALNLTPDNLAQVTVTLNSRRFIPLHQGTTASIGTVGLSGVTNRFVALQPGPTNAPEIHSNSVLPETSTTPIVDIDELLDSITPPVRASLRRWLQEGAGVLHGNVAGARTTLNYAAAALERTDAFIGQLTSDRVAFTGLLSSGARTATALASEQGALRSGVENTASALTAVAAARSSLASTLDEAPAVLGQGTRFLARLRPTLRSIDPVLVDAAPVAAPLGGVLERLVPTTSAAAPVLRSFDAILPELTRALQTLPALSRVAVPALAQTTTSLERALPIFTGLRPYGDDILLGILHGYGGGSAENYDANGQFSRIALGLPATTLLTSELGFDVPQLSPTFLTGQLDKCPGSAAEPAPDNSNKVVVPGCDPKQTP